MGCSYSGQNSLNEEKEFTSLKDVIEQDKELHLETFLGKMKYPLNYINDTKIFISANEKYLPLAYAVLKNKPHAFTRLLENGADFSKMQDFFLEKNINPIEIMFRNDYCEVFELFLPIYLEKAIKKEKYGYSYPNHIATKNTRCRIILKTQQFFMNKPIPLEFSLDLIDSNGDNCFFTACRHGNYKMIQFFHTSDLKININFVNSLGENALMVTLKSYLIERKYDFHICASYLIEKGLVDITYNYQNVLKLVEYAETVSLIESSLEAKQISLKKKDLVASNPSSRQSSRMLNQNPYSFGSNFTINSNSSINSK